MTNPNEIADHDAEALAHAKDLWERHTGENLPEAIWSEVLDAVELFSMRPMTVLTLGALLRMKDNRVRPVGWYYDQISVGVTEAQPAIGEVAP